MQRYIAFLRGINVGGNSLIRMAELSAALQTAGFQEVTTYIQSGNVLFLSDTTDTRQLAASIEQTIVQSFKLSVRVVVIPGSKWKQIVAAAPTWWGRESDWKHNILILLPPVTAEECVAAIGELRPDVELMASGEGVVYQSISIAAFGRSAGGKLAALPIYKALTVRNYNTARTLAARI